MSQKSDYQVALDRLELSQMGAARLLGCNERTSRRWAIGDPETPRSVMLLFMVMHQFGLKPEDIDEIEEKVSRKWFKAK